MACGELLTGISSFSLGYFRGRAYDAAVREVQCRQLGKGVE